MALILVTGATAGLGRLTVASLVSAGHDVVLHARNAERLNGAPAISGVHDVVFGDLARIDDVLGIVERANAIGRFDAVIHNAGVLDGPDVHAVNVVAPYLMTALMPAPERVVFLSSSMHASGRTDLTALDLTAGRSGSYSDSKLWVTALAMAIADLRPGAMAHAVDPGWVPTRMGGPGAPDSLAEGHWTQEWLATAPVEEIDPRTGGYWHHRSVRRPHASALDPRFQGSLLAKLADHTAVSLSR